ncbi:DUF2292 domain-containing protein [Thermaerobacter composti]|uniref:DUF2292 domain-containing protein n=1 Tax=Thermaerobacter composti TaxID=554949 RepID=A0ABZ0QSC0_9FIRM|nr:DUF2292 domain-containing protein [Thermaerobacter composti]WPD20194.1 DUF2292 domain-containing protein [Thermaerobacter composti]
MTESRDEHVAAPTNRRAAEERARLEALTRVEVALRNLRYGRVVVTVQDGRPVLVEVVEQEKIA